MKNLLLSLFAFLLVPMLHAQGDWTCTDYFEQNPDPTSPGLYSSGDTSFDFDFGGDQSVVQVTVYTHGGGDEADQTLMSINGGGTFSVHSFDDDLIQYIDGVHIIRSDSYYPWEQNIDWTPAQANTQIHKFNLIGHIDELVVSPFDGGVISVCEQDLDVITDCDESFEGFPVFDFPPEGYIITGQWPFAFNGEQQTVSIEYYDYTAWDGHGETWPSDDTYFSVNNSQMIPIDSILQHQPLIVNGVTMEIDTQALDLDETFPPELHTGTILFSGEIDLIVTQQVESGMLSICTEIPFVLPENCDDYRSGNDPVSLPGIYLIDDQYTMNYDGTCAVFRMGIYGGFNQWNEANLGQANQTFFSVNGGTPVSLEDIVLQAPLQIDDYVFDIDTNSINEDFDLDFWTSGELIVQGQVSSLTMTQFESGLIYTCRTPMDDCPEPPCQIEADFSYQVNGALVDFFAVGSGDLFHWDFGEGNSADGVTVQNQYTESGTYTVCLENSMSNDTCSISICQDILIDIPPTVMPPEAGSGDIINPNGNGQAEFYQLPCDTFEVYDAQGLRVAQIQGSDQWRGRNESNQLLPAGLYFLKCDGDEDLIQVTSIW